MKYYSLNNRNHKVGFKEAVLNGLAPDKGLYFPEFLPMLPANFINNLKNYTNEEIAYQVLQPFIGDAIPESALKQIIKETIAFEFPLIEIEKNIFCLELFHGPTLAFKDVGARFMSRCLQYFNQDSSQENIILVATSGDTGGAVANGFLGVKGTSVIILYPSGMVSEIQEKQLTTLGQNISALEVAGTFDDCQAMVKKAFLDPDLKKKGLTSANSINIARWLPQMLYFFFAYKEIQSKQKKIYFSCPSGNFGNICAGVLAKKIGLPIEAFIAATNANDTIPRYLSKNIYEPLPTVATISNAMDVSDPSNFVRIEELYLNNINELQKEFSSKSFSDSETKEAMRTLYKNSNYIADPHGAIGYLGLKKELQNSNDQLGVFLETAHPIKFLETVEKTILSKVPIPERITTIMTLQKYSQKIKTYEELKNKILST